MAVSTLALDYIIVSLFIEAYELMKLRTRVDLNQTSVSHTSENTCYTSYTLASSKTTTQVMRARIYIITTLAILVSFTGSVLAQTAYTLKSATANVQGTSSLHDWESAITQLTWKGNLTADAQKVTAVKEAEVVIKVASIQSTKGKMMDNKTWEAFNYEKYPTIQFKLTTATVNAGTIEAKGNLTMAGVAKPIVLITKSKVLPTGEIQLTTSYKIKMTDYKMEPPTAMMGTIKVGDEVTVNFTLNLVAAKNL